MFYGEYTHALDNKSRIIVPAKFREHLKEASIDKLYVTRGLDRCLFVFSSEEWAKQESQFKTMSFTNTQARTFNRLFFSGAFETAWDVQGRMLIPAYLRTYAGISKDVIVVGVSNRFEVWAKEKWEEFYHESIDQLERIAENMMS